MVEKERTVTEIRSMRDRVGALIEKMPRSRLYDEARSRGFATLSAFLEAEDPSNAEERRAGLDAFTRMLMVADIKTRSDRYGAFFADPVSKFAEDDATRAMFPEWARRQWDGSHALAKRAQSQYLTTDFGLGAIQNTYEDDLGEPLLQSIEPAIPLGEVVGRARPVNRRDVRRRVMAVPSAADVRMLRIAEAAEIPTAKITEASAVHRLLKFGRALEGSYEALADMLLDELAMHIRMLALQTEVDQVAAAFDVMVNGDGNTSSSAESFNLTALDPATTANNLTVAGWLAFMTQWPNPFAMTAVVGPRAAILKLLMLNVGSANTLASALPAETGLRQTFVPMNNRLASGVRFGIDETLPANKLLGFDGRFAIEHMRLAGSEISESARWISRQTEKITFSFWEGFAVYHVDAAKLLNLAA